MIPADEKPISVNEKLPRVGKWVIVVTPTYRCMGFLDTDGVWRDAARQEAIEDVQAWYRVSEDDTMRFKREQGM